jgi:ABC-type transporter Mla maintaining outer membrane lipid asymmetry ATPase subunit MlaF
MTLAENVALPMEQYTDMNRKQIREMVSLKLALVGLAGFERQGRLIRTSSFLMNLAQALR